MNISCSLLMQSLIPLNLRTNDWLNISSMTSILLWLGTTCSLSVVQPQTVLLVPFELYSQNTSLIFFHHHQFYFQFFYSISLRFCFIPHVVSFWGHGKFSSLRYGFTRLICVFSDIQFRAGKKPRFFRKMFKVLIF